MGFFKNAKFALAHNGVLWNDSYLRRTYNLPNDRIETDSFIAVQLLEHFSTLNFQNIAKMAEAVSGSFNFTMVDTEDNLWIVKGDNPLAIIHFPHLDLYVYASTTQILFTALCRTDLVEEIADGFYELVDTKGGDIIQINKNGKIKKDHFKYDRYSGYGYNWKTYTAATTATPKKEETSVDDDELDYISELYWIAHSMGISENEIDELINSGFSYDEIEDFIYNGGW